MTTLKFTKGHGTQNDFVLLFDEHGEIDLTPGVVTFLCDRRAGIGADGVIRAVRAGSLPAGKGLDPQTWFMDYWNADGSVSEMCGNGARVFGMFLEREAGVDAARRHHHRHAWRPPHGDVAGRRALLGGHGHVGLGQGARRL